MSNQNNGLSWPDAVALIGITLICGLVVAAPVIFATCALGGLVQ